MFNPFSKLKNFIIRKSVEKALEPLSPKIEKLTKGGTMKGWRTLLINALLVGLAGVLTYISGIDLADFGITGIVATIIMALVNFFLRFITTTPIGKKEEK